MHIFVYHKISNKKKIVYTHIGIFHICILSILLKLSIKDLTKPKTPFFKMDQLSISEELWNTTLTKVSSTAYHVNVVDNLLFKLPPFVVTGASDKEHSRAFYLSFLLSLLYSVFLPPAPPSI